MNYLISYKELGTSCTVIVKAKNKIEAIKKLFWCYEKDDITNVNCFITNIIELGSEE